jgi:hypothetical protein
MRIFQHKFALDTGSPNYTYQDIDEYDLILAEDEYIENISYSFFPSDSYQLENNIGAFSRLFISNHTNSVGERFKQTTNFFTWDKGQFEICFNPQFNEQKTYIQGATIHIKQWFTINTAQNDVGCILFLTNFFIKRNP